MRVSPFSVMLIIEIKRLQWNESMTIHFCLSATFATTNNLYYDNAVTIS
jgi:hypothetical protein